MLLQADTYPYYLAFVSSEEDGHTAYCVSSEEAVTVHPAEATWLCESSSCSAPVCFIHATVTSNAALLLIVQGDAEMHSSPGGGFLAESLLPFG